MISRRQFVVEVASLAALAACQSDQRGGAQDTQGGRPRAGLPNPDSRLDTGLHHAMPASSATSGAATPNVPFHTFDATLPPRLKSPVKIHLTARETPVRLNDSTIVSAWTFDGDIPAPILHVRQGDSVEFTLTNAGTIPHSMDFHAAQINPKVAFRSVVPGQSITFTYTPHYAGAFLYHCGTAPVLMHIGSGMFGAIIVDPVAPLPAAKEFVLVQNEFYLSAGPNGVSSFDYTKMLGTLPDLFAFNGRPDQYQTAPLRVKLGDLVRFYVVNAGPTHPCAFHIVGEQFDTVYLGSPPGNAIHGVQTFEVGAGGGMIFELKADVAGEFVFVNHAFGHGQKGAIGQLIVEA